MKYFFSANAIIVVGMEESAFLNAFRSNKREKKNKKIPWIGREKLFVHC